MREGLIVLPKTVPARHHTDLADRLLEAFGGYTEVEAHGAWRDPHTKIIHDEQVSQYVVAYEPNPDQDKALRGIADWLLSVTNEIAIYMRYADGNVSIVNR